MDDETKPVEQTPEPKVVIQHTYRIKYVYEVYHLGNQRYPAFELSVIETNPNALSAKVIDILTQNVGDIKSYLTRLKTMEVLE